MAEGPGGDPVEWLQRQLDLSRFLAARGDRAPAVEIPELPDVDRTLTALSRASRHEFLTLHDAAASAAAGPPQPTADPAIVDHNRAMLRRGVAVRELLTADGAARESTARLAEALERDGGRVRLVPELPFKAALVDRSVALLPLHPGSRTFRLGALLVRDAVVVDALHAAAGLAWASADPVSAGPDPLPPALRPVLDALLQGHLDVAAARRLGLSPRTYSRRVRDLLALLGVDTRAQAGAAAASRGWTRP